MENHYVRDIKTSGPNFVWLGFDSRNSRLLAGDTSRTQGMLAPGEFVVISQRPQILFRGERLFVWQRNASSFLIHGINVGHWATGACAQIIPADAFATNMDKLAKIDDLFEQDKHFYLSVEKNGFEAMGQPYTLPIAHPGMDILMYIENIDNVPQRFVAAFCGKGERP